MQGGHMAEKVWRRGQSGLKTDAVHNRGTQTRFGGGRPKRTQSGHQDRRRTKGGHIVDKVWGPFFPKREPYSKLFGESKVMSPRQEKSKAAVSTKLGGRASIFAGSFAAKKVRDTSGREAVNKTQRWYPCFHEKNLLFPWHLPFRVHGLEAFI